MKKVLITLGSLIGVFVLWALLRTPSPEEVERSNARMGIDACWQDQQRKSLEPSQARFIASVCEKMEADYRKKHGRNP